MNETRKKARPRALITQRADVIQEIFMSYITFKRDGGGANLVEAVLDETVQAAKQLADDPGDTMSNRRRRGKKAAELLEKLPGHPPPLGERYSDEVGLPETRRVLFEHVIHEMLDCTENEDFLWFAEALLKPVPLTQKETEALRVCLREQFDQMDEHHAAQLCYVLRNLSEDPQEVVYRGMLQAVARYAPTKAIDELLGYDEAA